MESTSPGLAAGAALAGDAATEGDGLGCDWQTAHPITAVKSSRQKIHFMRPNLTAHRFYANQNGTERNLRIARQTPVQPAR